jgi:antitoxin component YwqK of YwqJK toxin-antitoxin module
MQEGNYLQGKENGEWKFYDESGRLSYQGDYSYGNEIGIWYKFTSNGKKKVYKKYD